MWSHHSSQAYDSGNIPEDGEERFQKLDHQEVYSKAISFSKGYINKTGTMPISTGVLTGNGEILQSPTPRQSTTGNWWLLGRRISPFQEWTSFLVVQYRVAIPVQPWNHIHRNNKSRLGTLYLYICATYLYNNNEQYQIYLRVRGQDGFEGK